MKLYIENHSYDYELENLIRAFFINEKIEKIYNGDVIGDDYVYSALEELNNSIRIVVEYKKDDVCLTDEKLINKTDADNCEFFICSMLFDILSKASGKKLKWGMLTGIRPVKLLRSLYNKMGKEKAMFYFENDLKVSHEKAILASEIADRQMPFISRSTPYSFSLYLSIPFCPSRCNYCSFISQSIEGCKKLIPKYLDLLCSELEYTGKIVKDLNLQLDSIYIGGGTPTTLSESQLKTLLNAINENYDTNICKEFTVEAGRPDTITKEKLNVLKSANVSRISINPQSLDDMVLEAIGRKHSSKQTIEAFELARSLGFSNINMDLIAGLNMDSLESFSETIEKIVKLSPENITLHTLALKKSSDLKIKGKRVSHQENKLVQKMVELAYEKFQKNLYKPYYLYRQSRMIDNLENTGFSKDGFESAYNIFMMEEVHTVLACGASAVSKMVNPYTNKIERIFNFKYPYEYIERFAELIDRKKKVKEFYAKFL